MKKKNTPPIGPAPKMAWKDLPKPEVHTVIQNCNFTTTTSLDKASLEAVTNVSKALLNLTDFFLKQSSGMNGISAINIKQTKEE